MGLSEGAGGGGNVNKTELRAAVKKRGRKIERRTKTAGMKMG